MLGITVPDSPAVGAGTGVSVGFGLGVGVGAGCLAAHPLVKRITPRIMTVVGFMASPERLEWLHYMSRELIPYPSREVFHAP
jgi:hypothetical protein